MSTTSLFENCFMASSPFRRCVQSSDVIWVSLSIPIASGFASNRVATEYRSVAYEYRRLVLLEAEKHLILQPDLSAKALEINAR